MADWSNPKLNSPYVNFLNELNAKIVEAASILPVGTNMPTGLMRLERGQNIFQEWSGSAWVTKPIGVAGGGTGGATGNEARVNLGFGTMALQNANGVAITGGAITGTNLDATYLTAGIIPDARFPDPLPARNGGNLTNLNAGALAFGQVSNAARLGTGAVGSGLKYLADNLTWKEIKMAPRVFHMAVSIANTVPSAIQALPATVNVSNTFISLESGFMRPWNTGSVGGLLPYNATLCDSGGNPITAGPATHIKIAASVLDNASVQAQTFFFSVVEYL